MILGTDAPEAQELVLGQAQRAAQRFQVIVDQLGREAIVAGVDRRVRREHRALGDLLRARPEVRAGQLHQQARVLQRREGAVALVQVQAAPVDAGGAQRAHAADAQQQLLADADALVAEVQAGGELAVLLGVPVDVGVEQEQLVAPDRDLPHLRAQRLPRQRHLDDDRLARRGQRGLGGQHLRRATGRTRRAASRRGRCAAGNTTRGRRGRPPPAAAPGRTRSSGGRPPARPGRPNRSAATRGCRTRRRNRRPGGRAAGRHAPNPRSGPRPGSRAIHGTRCRRARAARRPREVLEALRREAGQHRDRVVVRGPETPRVEIPKQLDDVRVPGPPQVPRQLGELAFELFAGRHEGRDTITSSGRRSPAGNVVIVPPLAQTNRSQMDGQQRFISLVMAGGKGSRLFPAHPRSRQAGGAVRRPLPDHRLRPVEPGELGHPLGLRADAVQVAVAGGARAAHLGIAQRAATTSSRSCRRRCAWANPGTAAPPTRCSRTST